MNPDKRAQLQHPIEPLLADRWSPYVFESRPVAREDIQSLFEAVRWAPSSYNEQPWRYLVATQDGPTEFKKLLSCLVEANQGWAQAAWVLALGVTSTRFSRNDKANRTAHHDLGLGSASLCLEATKRGLAVHQMSGILPDRARDLYHVPEGFDIHTGLAIGYAGSGDNAPEALRERDQAARSRKQLAEFVFTTDWEKPWSK
jgi:nitroreductase